MGPGVLPRVALLCVCRPRFVVREEMLPLVPRAVERAPWRRGRRRV